MRPASHSRDDGLAVRPGVLRDGGAARGRHHARVHLLQQARLHPGAEQEKGEKSYGETATGRAIDRLIVKRTGATAAREA